jgi:hypothetical protein
MLNYSGVSLKRSTVDDGLSFSHKEKYYRPYDIKWDDKKQELRFENVDISKATDLACALGGREDKISYGEAFHNSYVDVVVKTSDPLAIIGQMQFHPKDTSGDEHSAFMKRVQTILPPSPIVAASDSESFISLKKAIGEGSAERYLCDILVAPQKSETQYTSVRDITWDRGNKELRFEEVSAFESGAKELAQQFGATVEPSWKSPSAPFDVVIQTNDPLSIIKKVRFRKWDEGFGEKIRNCAQQVLPPSSEADTRVDAEKLTGAKVSTHSTHI